MIDPIKSLMTDVTEYWNGLAVGAAVTAREIYREVVQAKEKNPDIIKLNAIGAFLNNMVRYNAAEKTTDKVVDAPYRKISNETHRPKNKRFCDVINSEFRTNDMIEVHELSLRYKNAHPQDPITKNYVSKLLIALESHGHIKRVKKGVYVKLLEIPEIQMTNATRFVKNKAKAIPANLQVPKGLEPGVTVVKVLELKKYLDEIETLKLIVAAQRKEIDEKDKLLSAIPNTDLPDLKTADYADLKEKYGIQ